MVRLFVALPVPPEAAARLLEARAGIPGARWLEPANLHLTLRFLGEVGEGEAADAAEALAEARGDPVPVRISGHHVFRRGSVPHSIVALAELAPELDRLKRRVDRLIDPVAPEPRRRRYTPHVTLARMRRGARASRLPGFLEAAAGAGRPSWTADSFVLYSSHLGREGASYVAEETYPLAGPGNG